MEKIKIAKSYSLDGKKLNEFPSQFLDRVEVEYLELPSWKENISDIRKFDDLPKNCKDFVVAIEDLSGVPVKIISVGPQRDETIIRAD